MCKRLIYKSVFLIIIIFITVGCATQPIPNASDPPGFLLGLLHGITILFSLIGSLFTEIRIYAFPNSGVTYDLGFVIGISIFGGGSVSL